MKRRRDKSEQPAPSQPATQPASSRSTPLKINVGGQAFWTTSTTLTSTAGHVLHRICSDGEAGMPQGTALRDAEGNIFIDRDPTFFAYILNYLRDDYVPLPITVRERLALRQEAHYYGLQLFEGNI